MWYTVPMQAKGAIFDQDGLLFDTEVVFGRAWRRVGAEIGVAVTDEMMCACRGCGRNEVVEVVRRFHPGIDAEGYVARVLDRAYREQMGQVPTLKPGVREMLARCREKGLRTAVASSSLRALVEHNLCAAGLRNAFDAVVTGEDVARGKPAPDIFLLAASRLSLPPSDCLVFEDAFSGIRAAHAAGCLPVLVPDRTRPTAEILKLCRSFGSLVEAAAWLG